MSTVSISGTQPRPKRPRDAGTQTTQTPTKGDHIAGRLDNGDPGTPQACPAIHGGAWVDAAGLPKLAHATTLPNLFLPHPESEEFTDGTDTSPTKRLRRTGSDSTLLRKATKTTSPYFTSPVKKKRAGAGKPELSCNSVPPLTAKSFGLIQERYWNEPFQMMVAVIFLNRTKGIHAIPVFLELMERYPTAELLAVADRQDICGIIQHLGFQNQRAKGLIELAQIWLAQPPDRSRRYRTLNYPRPGDGHDIKAGEVLGEDDPRSGALEIAHLPRLGPYGWDSWRIFCRDCARGLAEDYNGAGAAPGFEPEWKRVQPQDKELRACLRWMWLREGWEWEPASGVKRAASAALVARANSGMMLWEDLVPDEDERPSPQALAAQITLSEVLPRPQS